MERTQATYVTSRVSLLNRNIFSLFSVIECGVSSSSCPSTLLCVPCLILAIHRMHKSSVNCPCCSLFAEQQNTRRRRENEQEREENLNFLKLNVKLRLRYCLLPCHVEGYKFLHLRSRFMVPVHFIGNCHLGNYSKHFHPATLQRRNHG
jgi:hypothetical protein